MYTVSFEECLDRRANLWGEYEESFDTYTEAFVFASRAEQGGNVRKIQMYKNGKMLWKR
jgi:hypothetical protein